MSWFLYVRKTPVAQMRKDWKEYGRLKRQFRQMDNMVKTAYKSIQVEYKYNPIGRYCMVVDIPVFEAGREERHVKHCRCFFNRVCGNGCPFAFRHNWYWQTTQRKNELMQEIADFWQGKMQKLK